MQLRLSTIYFVIAGSAACASPSQGITPGHLDSSMDTAAASESNDDGPAAKDAATQAAAATSSTGEVGACATAAVWRAQSDFAFDAEVVLPAFADVVNPSILASDVSPIAITTHLEPHCVWKAAFSADESVSDGALGHAASSTQVMRHPQGLWTSEPEEQGWVRIPGGSSGALYLPLVDITASAKYKAADCAVLAARVSATIPREAGAMTLNTAHGKTTLSTLLGKPTSASPDGWKVRMTFTAAVGP